MTISWYRKNTIRQELSERSPQMNIAGHACLVKIHLGKHKVSGQHQSFRAVKAPVTDPEPWSATVSTGDSLHGADHPVQVKPAILNTRMVRVTEQVVHTVGVHLSINQITLEQTLLGFCAAFKK